MRITFLSWRDTSHPDGGGAEVYLEAVAGRLVSRGHEVTVVCAAHGRAPREETVDGVRVVRVGGRLTVYPRALLWVARRRSRDEVVVDVVNGLPFAARLVAGRRSVVLVHHLHEAQWRIIYPGWSGRLGWWLESRLVPRLYRRHRWITVSRATRDDLVGLGVPPAAVTVASNGSSGTALDDPTSPTPTLCVLARLVPHKRIEHALQVLAALAHEHPDLRLDVVGEGWWRDHLVPLAGSLGVADRVRWHGHVTAAERDAVLRRAWVMLLPSVKEGWGLAVTEAALQETPTVAYRGAGGVAESVRDGVTGVLVDDLEEMVVATRRLLSSPAERAALGREARRAAQRMSWESTTESVERVLLDVTRRS